MKAPKSYLGSKKKPIFQTGEYTSRLSDKPRSGFHESFRTSNTFFQQIIDSLDEYAIFTTDTLGRISSWNTGAAKILGYKEKEIIGKNSAILFTPQDRRKGEPKKELNTAAQKGLAINERWHVRRDKSRFWGSGRVYPLYDPEKKLRGFTKIMRDLTNRKKSEEIEKRFQSITENSSDGVRMIDAKGKILYASPSTKRILGYSMKEYLNHKITTFIHPKDKKEFKNKIQKTLKYPGKTIPFTYRIKHKKGEYRWMEGVGVNLLHDPAVQAIVANFRDITDRKKAEAEKEYILHQFKAVLEQLPAGVIIVDAKTGKFVLENAQVKKILREKDFCADSYNDYKKYRGFHPDGKEYVTEEWPVVRAMKTGKIIKDEEIKIVRGDKTLGYVLVNGAPIKDKNRKIIAGVSTIIDITEKKEIEKRKDEFVSMASHELKTPITSLNLFIELLKKQTEKKNFENTKMLIAKIKQQTAKLAGLVNDFLDVSRIETGKMRFRAVRFDLNELITDIIDDLSYTTTTHEIRYKPKEELLIVCDKYRIYQVFTNLLTNAIKYSPDNTIVIVKAKKKDKYIEVSVKDQGIGIAKDQHQKIFEKLYQIGDLKEKTFPGLGMGLYISKEIIHKHGGQMWVKSKKGKGATFYFTLPLKTTFTNA